VRARWAAVAAAAAVGLSATMVVVALAVGPSDPPDTVVAAVPVEVRGDGDAAAIVPAPPAPFHAATAMVPGLGAFATPDPADGTAPAFVAANPTHEGFPLVVSVVEEAADGDWLLVRFPQRPNGTTGWVRSADVSVWDLQNRIEVSVSARTLRVLAGDTDEVLFETLVSVGADATPTPLGDFHIDIVNPLGDHPTYGWGQLSVSGFSDVLETFAGGIGQIAIHGWNRPSDMGRNVSNGCVRMNNDDIARVAELAPLGTPVRILP
jgi:lipoprotein-anchoring transpeptidase ErfK/SrfK